MNLAIHRPRSIKNALVLSFSGGWNLVARHREPVFVWSVFAVACVALFYHTYNATSVLPWYDGWHLVPWLSGKEPVTLEWLWRTHNEHRVFLPKAILFVLSWLSNYDLKLMTAFHAFLGCVSAFLVIHTLRVIRTPQRVCYLDVVPALTLIHWATYNYHHECQLLLLLPVPLFLLLLYALFAWLRRPAKASLVVAGTAMATSPLCGTCMLPATCLFPLYFLYLAYKEYFIEKRRLFALVVAFFVVATYALVACNVSGFLHPTRSHVTPNLLASLQAGLALLANAFGVFRANWAYLGSFLLAVSVIVFAQLAFKAMNDRRDREKAIVVLLAGFSILGLAFCIGHSRMDFFYPRVPLHLKYTMLVSPLFLVLWMGFAMVRGYGLFSLKCLLASVVLLTLGINYWDGYWTMRRVQRVNKDILFDAHIVNMTDGELYASRYNLGPQKQLMARGIDQLRENRLGVFQPRVRTEVRKGFLPYFNMTRLDVLRSCMRSTGGSQRDVAYNHAGVAGWTLSARPPSTAVLDLPSDAATLKLEFGVYPWIRDGMGFHVAVLNSSGQWKRIWSRRLSPSSRSADFGNQQATVQIPPLDPGTKLIVQTLPGTNRPRDFAYWSDLRILDKNENILDLPHRKLAQARKDNPVTAK